MIIEARVLAEKYIIQRYMQWYQPPHITIVYDFEEDKKTINKLLKELKKYNPIFVHIDGSGVKKTSDGWVAYLKIIPSEKFTEMKHSLLKHIKNFSSPEFQEYSYGDFYHITLCKCKKKSFAKNVARRAKDLYLPIGILRVSFIKDLKIFGEYDLARKQFLTRKKALSLKNYSDLLPFRVPEYRLPHDNDSLSNEYVISDLHFGHKNIIKYCGRPFSSVKEMDEYMIDEWNSIVGKDDIVYVLGDFAVGNPSKYLKKLNGKIFIVPGNHDLHIPKEMVLDDRNWVEKLLRVKPYAMVHSVRMSHYPGNGMVFGHIHNNNLREYPFVGSYGINVSAEVVNYRPVPIEEIINLLQTYL